MILPRLFEVMKNQYTYGRQIIKHGNAKNSKLWLRSDSVDLCSSACGERSIVMMFGGLHTELADLRAFGSWIESGGWTSNLIGASWHNNTSNRQLLS